MKIRSVHEYSTVDPRRRLAFKSNDGGSAEAGIQREGRRRDCVARAIAIAEGIPYLQVCRDIDELAKQERLTRRHPRRSDSQTGVWRKTYQKYLESMGWRWVPLMTIGSGDRSRLRPGGVPMRGRIIAKISHNLVAIVDGVIHDTVDPSRSGSSCVYGYFTKEEV